MRAKSTRTKEDALLLVVAVAAAAAAFVSVRQAAPPSPGLWVATAAALALALTGVFAFWFGGAAKRRLAESLHGEWDAARTLLSAIPDGLLLVRDRRICSVNRELCELLGFGRQDLLGQASPFPFWPPEHLHEIEAWHDELEALGENVAELTFCRRSGDRVRVLVAGQVLEAGSEAPRHLVTVRDVSATHRRERRLAELASRDPETGLLDRRELEDRLGHAVRRARQSGANVAVVAAQLSVRGVDGMGSLARPEALVAVDRLTGLLRAGDELARTGEDELTWVLPATSADGAVEAVARWRAELGDVVLTAGVADLERAGDTLALYALADRALAVARRRGPGAIERDSTPPEGLPSVTLLT